MTVYDGIILTFILIGIIIILVSFLYVKYDTYTTTQKEEKKEVVENRRIEYEEVTGKIIELNEYGEYLKEELEKKHKELLFMYQMILEKQKELGIVKVNSLENYKKPSEHHQIKKETKEATIIHRFESENNNVQNKEILDLSLAGYNNQDIAKKLGIGVGQVQLVLNLFK